MQPWLIERVERQLQAVLGSLVPGARVRYAPNAPAPGPGDAWVWWQQRFASAADAALSVGLTAAGAGAIAELLGRSGLPVVAAQGEPAQAVLRIVTNACASLADSADGDSGPLDTPPAESAAVFSIDLSGGGRHMLAMAANAGLARLIDDQFAEEDQGPGPVLLDLDLPVSISLGRARLEFKDLLRISTGSVVELDRMLGDAVDVTINDSVVARGEIVVVEGNYGVRIQTVSGAACRSLSGFQRSR